MGMEMLQTKTLDMVRKEAAMNLLAYNLIRRAMANGTRSRFRTTRAELQSSAAKPFATLKRPTSMNQRRSPGIFRYYWT